MFVFIFKSKTIVFFPLKDCTMKFVYPTPTFSQQIVSLLFLGK